MLKSLPFRTASEKFQWYDNEWSYSNRCVDRAIYIAQKMSPNKGSEKAAARV